MIKESTNSKIITSEKAKKFCENIDKMKSAHKEEVTFSERLGFVPDYSLTQEKRDLEIYRFFMNSFLYDELKRIQDKETKEKSLALTHLRKRSLEIKD